MAFLNTVNHLLNMQPEKIAEEIYTEIKKVDSKFVLNVGEKISWIKSIPELLIVLKEAELTNLGLILEYKVLYEKQRIDAIVTGFKKGADQKVSLLVELKQWGQVGTVSGSLTEVEVYYKGKSIGTRRHPLIQVASYIRGLDDNPSEFSMKNIELFGCSFLHNLIDDTHLLNEKFQKVNTKYKLFGSQNREDFHLFK